VCGVSSTTNYWILFDLLTSTTSFYTVNDPHNVLKQPYSDRKFVMLLESILVFDICGDNSRLTTVQGSTVMPSIDLYWMYPLLNATIIATNAMVYLVGGYCEVSESETTRLEASSTFHLRQPALTGG
jgi:hypothetical protein